MHLEIEKLLHCWIYNTWAGLFPPVESDASASAFAYTTDAEQTLLIGIARRDMHLPCCHFPLQIPFPIAPHRARLFLVLVFGHRCRGCRFYKSLVELSLIHI